MVLTTCGTDPDATMGSAETLQSSSHQSLRVPFTGPGIDPAFGLAPILPSTGSRLGPSPVTGGTTSSSGSFFSSQISRSTGEYSLFGTVPTTTSGP